MKVWLVIQWRDGQAVPEVQGIFSAEAGAVAACKTANYLVWPMTVDEPYPDEPQGECPDCYFPLAKAA